jgi:predicted CoA-binding protein
MASEESARLDYRQLFAEIRSVAAVGYSDNPERAGHFVPQYLRNQGYEVIAVNPKFGSNVEGLANYPSLSDIPDGKAIDVIDVFRSPDAVPALAREAVQMNPRPRYFWMQPGAVNAEAASIVAEAGIIPISGDCMLAEHKRL